MPKPRHIVVRFGASEPGGRLVLIGTDQNGRRVVSVSVAETCVDARACDVLAWARERGIRPRPSRSSIAGRRSLRDLMLAWSGEQLVAP